MEQAEALRQVLDELSPEQVADFQRTFVRLNRDLVVSARSPTTCARPGWGSATTSGRTSAAG